VFDFAKIEVKAGDGGNGAVSFRHEKYVPFGGPDGGHGGRGGDVVVAADLTVSNLRTFVRRKSFHAENGGGGAGQKMHGQNGAELVLAVPLGTIVAEQTPDGQNAIVADLEAPGQRVVVALGGGGGAGNSHFATPTNQAPQTAKKGKPGEQKVITLELKLIADVGLIGYPNVGKSSLLAAVSAAQPRIADYPFTTREPVLGMVEVKGQVFVLTEIPGLIDGAHRGRGLGHEFLRHTVRTRMLIHLIDGGSPTPVQDMEHVDSELTLFDPALGEKPQLVAVNKIDLPEVKERLGEIKQAFTAAGTSVFFISAATGEGIPDLMAETLKKLRALPPQGVAAVTKVFRPLPKSPRKGRKTEA
jgi:GTP-binding protein